MRALAIFAIVLGLVLGAVGGLLGDQAWLGAGAGIALLGVTGLWTLAIFKDPASLLKAEGDVEAMASGWPTRPNEMLQQREPAPLQTTELTIPQNNPKPEATPKS
jgi:hypothetical protein